MARKGAGGGPGHGGTGSDEGGGSVPAGGLTLLAAAVLVHDRDAGRVLLLRRGSGSSFGQGMWDLPVGKNEYGEPVTATAVRELREETGLVVEPGMLRAAHVMHGARGRVAPNGYLTVVFAARSWSGRPVNREPHKHSEIRWASTGTLSRLPGGLVPSTAVALRHCLDGGPALSLPGWT